MDRVRVHHCVEAMVRYVEAADYAGYDPYDALNSPLLQCLGARSKWIRIAATQLVRRSPVNLRPVLGIRKEHNAKGIGLFLWGYTKLYALEKNERYLAQIDYLLTLLEQLRSPGYSGNCWGYNFDWQSRTYLRPKKTPTIVNTAFIGHALLDCFDLAGRGRAMEMAISIGDFVLRDLNRTQSEDGYCFSYTPVDRAVVHNANLLGASILARLSLYVDDDRLETAALSSLRYSMRHQQNDGSWYYANTAKQKWVDSFHTGFNLQAIRYIREAGLADEYQSAYQRGVRYYAENFFLDDGTPKYYHDRVFPIDIHAPAQAVCFFSREGEHYGQLTDSIVRWMLDHLYSGDGLFYFRKTTFGVNRIPYMRWSQAWAFRALIEYLYSRSERSPHACDERTSRTNRARRADNVLPISATGHRMRCPDD